MTSALPLLLAAAALAASPAPAPAPRTPIAWVLGAKPTPGAFATYDTETRAKTFTGDLSGQGADPKEVELVQKTRATFLYLGPATVEGARGEWLEVQEELVAMEMPGMPAGAGPQGSMVTRVLLDADGKVLRVVSQMPDRPAQERAVDASTSIAIGALQPFGDLVGKLAAGKETVPVAGLGPTPAITAESSGPAKVKIWRRANDGLCVKLVSASDMGKSTYTLVRAGSGGKTRIAGEIQKAADDPQLEQFRRMQEQQER